VERGSYWRAGGYDYYIFDLGYIRLTESACVLLLK